MSNKRFFIYLQKQTERSMNRVRISIFAVVVVLVGFVAFGLCFRPRVQEATSAGFSAARVVEDIKVISQNHHSVAHPEARAQVRNYLVDRLNGLGADTVVQFEYKDLTGPENKHVVYTFDATNILATFSAPQPSGSTLLLVAHYDSRYSQPMPKQDTVWSYGAADDGYGVGVILESVAQALKYRSEWKQSVKVLFTDAEEVGMKGMKAMWERDRAQFEDVGLMINLEARGPFGPALLFETSPGNERLMELYSQTADYPFTYSLTTVVYSFMPNFTDFTIVKDDIPGLNFSTIADINHYHTDLDNFGNINPKSIQHYGAQITPLMQRYLTDSSYSDVASLKAESDTVNFTIPLLGLFNFSKGKYALINIITFVLFALCFVLEMVRGRLQVAKTLREALIAPLAAIGALAVGELVAFVCGGAAGAKFKPFGIMQGIAFDNEVMIASVAVMTVVAAALYARARQKATQSASSSIRATAVGAAAAKFATNRLYGALTVMFLFSALLLVALGENLMFFIPLFAATAAMILYRTTTLKLWLLLAVAVILLHCLSFLYALTMALTIGAFGAIMMLLLLDLFVILPLADLYLSK